MRKDPQSLRFPYRRHADQDAGEPVRHPVVIVGAGPVGLSLAIDLAQQAVPVVVLDNDDRLSTGSRAICFAKRTLEVFDRLGCGEAMVEQGVSWQVGKVFLRDEEVYRFDLLPATGHARPAFINLQQYHVEAQLLERAAQLRLIDLRWKNEVSRVTADTDGVVLTVDTPEGPYRVHGDHVIACDGSRSAVRRQMGLEAHGQTFRDRFLIADVRMALDFPAERWFWFDPPFHPGQSVLLHKQPEGVWRIDFQLGWEADPEAEKQPERILPRVQALLAHTAMKDAAFTLEWASVYTFSCERMDRFRHGRVIFAGDAAHRVSPFGARGANSGVQDADNLGWKLAAVLRGEAGDALLESYAQEREFAADENIRHSTRATDFITPKTEVSRLFRDATLALAKDHAFARSLVNSGRLSTPTTLLGSALNTADVDAFDSPLVPGAPAADAALAGDGDAWLLQRLHGGRFCAIVFDGPDTAEARRVLEAAAEGLVPIDLCVLPTDGVAARRYDGRPGTTYLLRPDQHVCARWRQPTRDGVAAALRRALARD